MEDRVLVVERFALFTCTFLAGAKCPKVFHSLRDGITEKTHDDTTTTRRTLNFNIEINLAGDLFCITTEEYIQCLGVSKRFNSTRCQGSLRVSTDLAPADKKKVTSDSTVVMTEAERRSFMIREQWRLRMDFGIVLSIK